jgi:hypothetical protein
MQAKVNRQQTTRYGDEYMRVTPQQSNAKTHRE